jgi:hypothetical protein
MAVTTTDTISRSKFRCGRCGKPVAGDWMVGGVGICCVANEADRALLRSLIGDAEAPAEEVRVYVPQTLRPNPAKPRVEEVIDAAGAEPEERAQKSWVGGRRVSQGRPNEPALPVGGMVPIGSRKARR